MRGDDGDHERSGGGGRGLPPRPGPNSPPIRVAILGAQPPLTEPALRLDAPAGPPSLIDEPSTSPGYGKDEGSDAEARATIPPGEPTQVHDREKLLERLREGRQVRDRHLIVCMHGSFLGRVVRLGPAGCSVGRQQGADLWMPDTGVSRAHARLEADGDGFAVQDLGSANGTYVNGERVTRRRLADGDLVQLGPAVVLRYLWTEQDHERMLANLYEASVRDPLTGAFNREHLDERLDAEVAFARRHRTEVAVAMFDLDHFKRVNDTYGHLTGDRVLTAVAAQVRLGIRLEDLLGRFGGEEFVVVLRNIALPGAVVVAERLRALVSARTFETDRGEFRVSASFGCATLACCPETSPGTLIEVADRRLLIAKRLGRDRVVAAG